MFGLRFCAHWIENTLKLSPVGLLFVCSALAACRPVLASGMNTFTTALIALGIYAVGKTFFWPTMLAVASDRFPRTVLSPCRSWAASACSPPASSAARVWATAKTALPVKPQGQEPGSLHGTYKAATPSTFLNLEVHRGLRP
jgi:hypothetical protein